MTPEQRGQVEELIRVFSEGFYEPHYRNAAAGFLQSLDDLGLQITAKAHVESKEKGHAYLRLRFFRDIRRFTRLRIFHSLGVPADVLDEVSSLALEQKLFDKLVAEGKADDIHAALE